MGAAVWPVLQADAAWLLAVAPQISFTKAGGSKTVASRSAINIARP
jgi:hypothetical protein